jgi:hypothetical protein
MINFKKKNDKDEKGNIPLKHVLPIYNLAKKKGEPVPLCPVSADVLCVGIHFQVSRKCNYLAVTALCQTKVNMR